jgi:hypothetical protein
MAENSLEKRIAAKEEAKEKAKAARKAGKQDPLTPPLHPAMKQNIILIIQAVVADATAKQPVAVAAHPSAQKHHGADKSLKF